MKKLEAMFDNIIVKPLENNDKVYGNIVVPDLGKEKGIGGKVIAVGPGRVGFTSFISTTIKVGDEVILPPAGPIVIDFENEQYYVCSENQVLAVIKSTNE